MGQGLFKLHVEPDVKTFFHCFIEYSVLNGQLQYFVVKYFAKHCSRKGIAFLTCVIHMHVIICNLTTPSRHYTYKRHQYLVNVLLLIIDKNLAPINIVH